MNSGKRQKKFLNGNGQRHAILISDWNYHITERLQIGAKEALLSVGVKEKDLTEFYVPGAFELGSAALTIAKSKAYDAIICLGCVIRGGTPHFDYVCQQSARLIAQAAYDSGIPVIFGVLTTDTIEQAMERSERKNANKGYHAALAAVEMATLYGQLKETAPP